MSDPLITAMRRLNQLHPRSFDGFDMGAEIERANRLMERADGSFYSRGPTVDDLTDDDSAYERTWGRNE